MLETGVWLANELVSFDSYGAALGALPNKGLVFGPGAMGPKRMPMARGLMPTGGLLYFAFCFCQSQGCPQLRYFK